MFAFQKPALSFVKFVSGLVLPIFSEQFPPCSSRDLHQVRILLRRPTADAQDDADVACEVDI